MIPPPMPAADARMTPPPLPPGPPPPLPPGPPPPLDVTDDVSPPSLLTQLFGEHKAALACQHLLQLSPREAAEELNAAFAAVEWAPNAFLLALAQWPATAPRNVFFSLVHVGTECMQTRLQQSQPHAILPSPMVSDLAGALLLDAFADCRANACAAFIAAFHVSIPHLHAHCARLLPHHVKVVVTILDVLNKRQLVPLDVVVIAAIQQNELEAADAFVRDDAPRQRLYLQMLIDRSVPDKIIKKRLTKFKIADHEFPEYHARRMRASIRFLVYNQQYEDVLSLVDGHADLGMYACFFVVNKRGSQDPLARLFVHRSGHADKDEFAYIDTTNMATETFPNKDDLAPLASCLSLAELTNDESASVMFVDTPAALQECVNHLRDAPVVGFDCEWKTATTRGREAEACAVLQLASATRAFVIDTIALKQQCAPLREIFISQAIVKLGFDTKGDVSVLAKVLPKEETAPHNGGLVRNLVDVQALAKRLRNVKQPRMKPIDATEEDGGEVEEGEIVETEEIGLDRMQNGVEEPTGHATGEGTIPEVEDATTVAESQQTEPAPSATGDDAALKKQRRKKKQKRSGHRTEANGEADNNDSSRLSLAAVAELYLGKPLDKRSRMSDWERRPLTRAQLHYAAMDALVLVAIFDAMRRQFSEQQFHKAVASIAQHRGDSGARQVEA